VSQEEQRIAIAEACGWTATVDDDQFWRATRADGSMTSDLWCSMSSVWNVGIPDYLNDLNAMHEAEKVLTNEQDLEYSEALEQVVEGRFVTNNAEDMRRLRSATAPQRAEAFLRTIGKWKEANP
jgi:hypothetical protein